MPPRSENLFYLRVARFDQSWNILFAERLLSLHQPGIRLCMGTMQSPDSFTGAQDQRSQQIAQAILDALADRFSADRIWVPPFIQDYAPPYPARGDWSLGVELVEHQGKRGYSFAIDPPSILQDVGPSVFRYREVELFEALAQVVESMGLAPVILWQLFGEPLSQDMPYMAGTPVPTAPGYYIVQLWEMD